jgi:hypothetical protein
MTWGGMFSTDGTGRMGGSGMGAGGAGLTGGLAFILAGIFILLNKEIDCNEANLK